MKIDNCKMKNENRRKRFRQFEICIFHFSIFISSFVAVVLYGSSLFAQPVPPAAREIKLVAKPGELDILRTVAIRPASSAAVSDPAGVLAVALKPKLLTTKERQAGVVPENGPH